jgi:hypothetical protein
MLSEPLEMQRQQHGELWKMLCVRVKIKGGRYYPPHPFLSFSGE